MRKSHLRFIISIIVGLILLYFTLQYFEIGKAVSYVKKARTDYLFLALFLLIIAYLLRGKRWLMWQKELRYWDSLKLILVGFMGNNVLPARLGEILRAHCAADKTESNLGRTAALASIVIERVLDGFVIAVIGLTGLLLVPMDKRLYWALMFVCLLFFVLTAGLLISIFYHDKIRVLMERINRTFPGHLTRYGKEKVNYFLDGLLLIRGFGPLTTALVATACIWGLELAMYYFIANAVFEGVSWETCLVFLSVVNFASLFPMTVGGLGAIEGATAFYLVSAGVPPSESLAMVLVQHGYQFFFTTVLGMMFYFTSRYYSIPIAQTNSVKHSGAVIVEEHQEDILSVTRDKLHQLSTNLGIQARAKRDTYLSIIIPAFNERNRLPKTVLETVAWCHRHVPSYEVIIADDGSSDDTLEIARLISEYDANVKVIACPHIGKGAAVRLGMLNAAGSHVLFMDADGATPLDQIPKLIKKIDDGWPVAIGSRVIQRPGEATVKTSLHRKIIGRTFAAVVNIFAVGGIADTQCGFKMFTQDVTRYIFSSQKINGFAFDVEILYIAKKHSLPIAEVPVNWVNQKGSKVNLITDSMKMVKDILRIRLIHRNSETNAKYETLKFSSSIKY